MSRYEIVYYKCILRPKLWWMGNESDAKHYLVQKKDYSFRVVGLSGIRQAMKYKFTEDDIEIYNENKDIDDNIDNQKSENEDDVKFTINDVNEERKKDTSESNGTKKSKKEELK